MTEREQLEQAITALELQRTLLGDAVVDTALAPLREKLAALDKKSTEQQRKLMTFLFMDVVQSSKIFGHLDPEDTLNILGNALGVMGEIVQRHEGQVGKLMGDGLMAYFGAPTAREDDAVRAVRAALEIAQNALIYARVIEEKWGVSGFQVRVGLNTGLVAFGEVGGGTVTEVTAMGDAVNMAARMEAHAPPGRVLISHDTFQHIKGIFIVSPLEPIMPKGALKPIPIYLVEQEKSRAFRLETRGVEGIETRMIGRDAELKQLQEAFDTAIEAAATQVITVLGDAGVGKSRLLYEFTAWLELLTGGTRYLKARALPEMSNVPYGVVRNMLAFRFEIHESDSPALVRDKLEHGVAQALSEKSAIITPQEKARVIGHLLGFDLGLEEQPFSVEQTRIARHYLIQFLSALTQLRAVIFWEDIHWADDASLDLLTQIAQDIPTQRLLIVCLSRPTLLERRPHWGEELPDHTLLKLQPLAAGHTHALVSEILQKVEVIPTDLRDIIVKGAEGNPFYIEELVRMFIEDGVIVKSEPRWRVEMERLKQVRVPATLTGVLQARLDSLPPQEKALLQRAAVVGRIFWDQAIEGLHAESSQPDISALLGALRGREMVFGREPSAFEGSREYIFKHALLRDVTYETVLKRLRRLYHRQVAEWLVERSGERVKEYLELIAGHYEFAGENALAVEYMRRAAQRANDTSYFREAVALVERALARQPSIEELMQLHKLAGDAYDKLSQYDSAKTHYMACLEIAQAHDNRTGQADGLYGLAVLANRRGDSDAAREYCVQSLSLSRNLDDHERISDILNALAQISRARGEFEIAQEYFQESLAVCRANDYQDGIASVINNLGILAFQQSDFATAKANFEESLTISRSLGNRAKISQCLTNLGAVAKIQNDYPAAVAYQEASLTMRREIGDRRGEASCLVNLGAIVFEQGDHAASSAFFVQSLSISRSLGDKRNAALCLLNLGISATNQGNFSDAQAYLNESLSLRRSVDDKHGTAHSLNALGELAMEQSQFEIAQSHLNESLNLRRTLGDKRGEAESLSALGWLYIGQGNLAAAQPYVEESLAINRAIAFPAALATSLNALGWIQMLQGHPTQARVAFCGALSEVSAIRFVPTMVASLIGLTRLLVEANRPIDALVLLGLVQQHLFVDFVPRHEAENLMRTLQDTLPADEFADAIKRGKSLDLHEVVRDLLAESNAS